MNKIQSWTYLYKEILQRFSEEITHIYIFDKLGNRINEIKEFKAMYISSENSINFQIHKELFGKDVLYITYKGVDKENHKCILDIGNKYKLYIDTKANISTKRIKYISMYIALLLCDFVVINKIQNIDEGIHELDIALDLGKDIYAIPGDIFKYENYLANFCIKQGATPICSKYDAIYVLKEKTINVL